MRRAADWLRNRHRIAILLIAATALVLIVAALWLPGALSGASAAAIVYVALGFGAAVWVVLAGLALFLLNRSEDQSNAVERLSSQLAESEASVQAFISAASHDLQEPLRKIESFGERLETKYADRLEDNGRLYLDRMVDAAARMRRLINDLITHSRVSDSNLNREEVDLGEIAADVVKAKKVQIAKLGAKVEIGDLPTVSADRKQMRVLFGELIENALKFRRPDETPQLEIEVAESQAVTRPSVTILFKDNGIGFASEHAERIFGFLERLHSRSEYDGTGVPLATCRKIVALHGGTLTATGDVGKGAVFTLILPISQ